MRLKIQLKTILAAIFIVAGLSFALAPVSLALSSRTKVPTSTTPMEESYYWETGDGGEQTIIGFGGAYQKKVVFKPLSETDDFEIFTPEGDIPIKVTEVEKGADPIECGKEFIKNKKNSNSDGNLLLLVNKNDGAAYTLVNQGKGGQGRTRSVEKNGKDVSGILEWEITDSEGNKAKCSTNLFHYINLSVPKYNLDTADNATIYGKMLGEKGVKFSDWVRMTDNKRDFRAIKASALNLIPDHCQTIKDSNQCQIDLMNDVEKCYNWSIGLGPNSDNKRDHLADKQLYNLTRDIDSDSEEWKHSFRENTSAFINCFGQQSNLDGLSVNKYFSSPIASQSFADQIIAQTLWPPSIEPQIDEKEEDKGAPANKTKCSIGALGWILCPTYQFIAKSADMLYKMLDNWMALPPMHASPGAAVYEGWKIFRDIANTVFVILILVIIIQQVAGGRLSKYSIGKTLPKIIILAIVLNVSFYLLSVLVDFSNIIGGSLYDALRAIKPEVEQKSSWMDAAGYAINAGGGLAMTTGILSLLAVFLPMVVAAAFSALVFLLILVFRQAFVIILVVLAPIAIATSLLPGTKSIFKKWKKYFTEMMFLYPVVAVVFGLSNLLSTIVMQSGSSTATISGTILAMFGLLIQVLPLFITPVIITFGGDTVQNFGTLASHKLNNLKSKVQRTANEAGGAVDRTRHARRLANYQKLDNVGKTAAQKRAEERNGLSYDNLSPEDKLRWDAEDKKDKAEDRKMALRKTANKVNPLGAISRHEAKRDAFNQIRQQEYEKVKQGVIGDSEFLTGSATAIAGGLNAKDRQNAEAAIKAALYGADTQEVRILGAAFSQDADKAIKDGLKTKNQVLSEALDQTVDQNKTENERVAALAYVVKEGDLEAINQAIDKSKTMSPYVRNQLAGMIESSQYQKDATYLTGTANIQAIREGTSVNELVNNSYNRGQYTTEALSTQSASAIAAMRYLPQNARTDIKGRARRMTAVNPDGSAVHPEYEKLRKNMEVGAFDKYENL